MGSATEPREIPGMVRPSRLRPKFHYELLVCGLRGHELVGLDAAEITPADALFARRIDGVRWHRCLRCDSWLPCPPPVHPARRVPPSQEQIELPIRGRPLRDKIILRLIAVDRALHFVVLCLLSIGVFLLADHEAELRDTFYRVLDAIHGGLGGTTHGSEGGFVDKLDSLLNSGRETLHLVGAALAAYAVLEGVEAIGLWFQKRWAEYLTLIATAALLPLEVYELTRTVTVLKVVALVVNIAVVVYLLFAKRLFGIRGGAAAERELSRRDVGWGSLEASAPESRA